MDPISQAYREKKKWEESMGVGTMDKMFDVLTGGKIDYDEMDFLGGQKPEDHHIDFENLGQKMTKTASATPSDIKTAIPVNQPLTVAQTKAVGKYPSLIEMLGNDETNELAEVVASALNKWIISRIHKNSASINKNAVECKQEGKCLKEYYKYEDKAGFVKAAGRFSGQEYLHYDPNKNAAYVLKRKDAENYQNVSNDFEIEFQFAGLK